ncbi:MAG: radical SAM protein [Candidatus Alcyoniella australis]|nr:radical SAM protein [Candidatus Alcyoniella australis]
MTEQPSNRAALMIDPLELAKARRRYLIRKGVLTKRAFVGPLETCIIPTYRCNYRCVFCALEWEAPGKKPDLPPQTIERVLEDLAALNCEQVSFTGGGEPLMYKPIDRMVQHARELGLAVSICTNGYLLNDERIESFARLGVHLSISLNAPDAETYVKTHPGTKPEDFERITGNLARYVRIARECGGPGSFVSLNFVITNLNWNLVPQIDELTRSIGANQIQFRLIQPRPVHSYLFLNPEQLQRTREDVRRVELESHDNATYTVQVSEILRSADLRTTGHDARGDVCGLLGVEPIDDLQRVPCIEGYIASYVDSDGIVFPCCLRSCSIENHYMGNVNEQPFAQIWNGPSYQGFRDEAFNIDYDKAERTENSCAYCPKAKAFLYMVDELAPGNLACQQSTLIDELVARLEPLEHALGLGEGQQPLTQEGCRVRFISHTLPQQARPGQELSCSVTLVNSGAVAWRELSAAGDSAVGLSYHLLDRRGRMLEFDGHPRSYLPVDVLPGQSVSLQIAVTAPPKSGRYQVEFTLIQEHVAWFEQRGAATLRVPLRIV